MGTFNGLDIYEAALVSRAAAFASTQGSQISGR